MPELLRSARFETGLLTMLLLIWCLTGIAPPAGHVDWALECAPGIIAVSILAATRHRFAFSRWVYICVFLHCLILTYGGFYTYAATPLGNFLRELLHGRRNSYDRLGHLAQGFFPAFVVRELLLRTSGLQRGKWLNFLTVATCLAFSAQYELFEWWTALVVSPAQSDDFLGTQGDTWDTQWDMFCCLIGAVCAVLVFRRLHDASMEARLRRPV